MDLTYSRGSQDNFACIVYEDPSQLTALSTLYTCKYSELAQ